MIKRLYWLLVVGLLISSAEAQSRGYTARACGFDLDDDGIIGEASDDCTICDGNTSTGAFTVDPDGDGVDEDINFVDSTGTDAVGCGAPDDPCATVAYVLAGNNSSYAKPFNGPGDGAEDIMCIAGSFTNIETTLTQSGLTTIHTARNNHEYPADPVMIIGWDQDRDGSYPPFDTDDTALFTRTSGSSSGFAATGQNYIEIAHLRYVDYCCGQWAPRGNDINHYYFHDIELVDFNRGGTLSSSTRTFGGFSSNMDWFAIENLSSTNQNAWFWRGGSDNSDHWRFSEITVTWFGGTTKGVGGIKWWGTNNFNTVENSIFDAQSALWRVTGGVTGINIPQCSQDWTLRNNELIDWEYSVRLQPAASGFCNTREIKNILIDGNRFDSGPHFNNKPDIHILNDQGGPTTTFIGANIKIINNFFYTSVSRRSAILDENERNGATNPGDITIAGNTFGGEYTRVVDIVPGPNPINIYTIKNNIFAGTISTSNLRISHSPTFTADGNVYSADANYHLNGTNETTLAGWQTLTGQDANSTVCTPTLVNPGAGDLHLSQNDTCAIGAGINIISVTALDIDGEPRSATSPDSGADEVQGGSIPPAPPQNVRLVP